MALLNAEVPYEIIQPDQTISRTKTSSTTSVRVQFDPVPPGQVWLVKRILAVALGVATTPFIFVYVCQDDDEIHNGRIDIIADFGPTILDGNSNAINVADETNAIVVPPGSCLFVGWSSTVNGKVHIANVTYDIAKIADS